MSNFKEKISVVVKMLMMTVILVAFMSMGMSVKVHASNPNSGSNRLTSSGNHNIRVTNDGHGTGSANPASASCDAIISLNAVPASGYVFDKWTTSDNIRIINPASASDAYFSMIDSDVTVRANFKAATNPSTPTSDPGAKYYYDHHDQNDHHEETGAPAQNPVNPNALLAVSFAGADGILRNAKLGPQVQGDAAQLAFRLHTPAGWKEAFTFNMTVNDQADYSLKKGTLSFLIPAQYQKAGRTFALLGIDKDGNVKMFSDTDTKPDTITVSIDIEGYAFDLIYFD